MMSFRRKKCKECGEKYMDSWCKSCQRNYLKNDFINWTSGNEEIDGFIQDMQLKIDEYDNDIVFEWIPYSQFNDIKEMDNDFATTYLAIWKDGPLNYEGDKKKYTRNPNIKVNLKCLYNSQNINEVLNEVKTWERTMYHGISQNPNTKDYIMVLNIGDYYCEKCGEKYTNHLGWCESCQLNYLKNYFMAYTSGNEEIDGFIQGMQSKINDLCDPAVFKVFEWIPYNQFNNIKEICKNGFATIYLAMWKDGPLHYDSNKKKYTRNSDEKVDLKCLHNSQNIYEVLNKIETHVSYGARNIYGISQNPDTKDYIMVLNDNYCECGGEIVRVYDLYDLFQCNKWCISCQRNYLKNDFINWTSGDKEIDGFIQDIQSKIDYLFKIVFEWIPYNQFNDIKEIGKDDSATIYLAMWKDGPLHYSEKTYTRNPNKKVNLKCLSNSQNINEVLNKFRTYSNYETYKIYGISQNPDTKDYIMVFKNKKNKYNCAKCHKKYTDVGEEWCKLFTYTDVSKKWCKPCQVNYLKNDFTNWSSGNEKINNFIQGMQLKIGKYDDIVFEWIPYSQFCYIKEISKGGFSTIHSAIWKNGPLHYDGNEKGFRRLELDKKVALKCLCNSQNSIDEVLSEVKSYPNNEIYGISQNSGTKDYIIVHKYDYCEKCSEKYTDHKWCKPCQIDCLKNNFTNWTSGSEEINNLIQEMQLRIGKYNDIVFEWIPYNQFDKIKEIGKDNFTSAIWKDGPLHYHRGKYIRHIRNSSKKVSLIKYLHNNNNNLQNITEDLNKVKYSFEIYGISQNPDTTDYIIVLNVNDDYCEKCIKKYAYTSEKWCKTCQINYLKDNFTNWTSGNKEIDGFIQEMQLKIDEYNDIVFEWIPYNQFCCIKEIRKGGFSTIHSAIWKNGPLCHNGKKKLERFENYKKVALKFLYKQNIINNEFLNEAKAYSIKNNYDRILKTYGISQDPNTKDYIIVLEYAEDGNISDWVNKTYKTFDWEWKLKALEYIITGIENIHEKQMVHRDLHIGNILVGFNGFNGFCVSDMGLCRKVDNILDETKIYGVMPYVAPEVLRGKPYTKAADIYSFGMIMYFVATGRQPFADCAHDETLALNICKGIRPEIIEPEAPECYIDLIKECWDSNPANRPNTANILEPISYFSSILHEKHEIVDMEIKKQFEKAEEYRKANLSTIKNSNHLQAIYTLSPCNKDYRFRD